MKFFFYYTDLPSGRQALVPENSAIMKEDGTLILANLDNLESGELYKVFENDKWVKVYYDGPEVVVTKKIELTLRGICGFKEPSQLSEILQIQDGMWYKGLLGYEIKEIKD